MRRRFSESVLILAVGAVLGPQGMGMLSAEVLSFLDPAMPVALVALGVLVGFGVSTRVPYEGRLLTAASAEAMITGAAVAAGVFLIGMWTNPGVPADWFPALVLGICAASSAVMSLRPSEGSRSVVERIANLDGLLPIALGGAALALAREQSAVAAMLVLLQASAVAVIIALAAWLLIGRASSDTEQRVFAAALLLLLGGAADYLSLSALLTGLIAGLFLDWIGGTAGESVKRDVLQFQHPLLVLVLIVAAAHTELPPLWIGIAAVYIAARTAGKLAGGFVVRRMVRADSPAASFLPPGLLGIAFALNVARAAGPDAAPLVAVVVIGAVASELLAAIAQPRAEPA